MIRETKMDKQEIEDVKQELEQHFSYHTIAVANLRRVGEMIFLEKYDEAKHLFGLVKANKLNNVQPSKSKRESARVLLAYMRLHKIPTADRAILYLFEEIDKYKKIDK